MPLGFFDDFADAFFSSVFTYVFNGTEVTTGVASSLVYPENQKLNTVNKTALAATINGTSFHDELMKKLNNASYPAFKNRFEEGDFVGYTDSSRREFPNFVRDNLPTSLLNFPHGPARDYFEFDNSTRGNLYLGLGSLRFESWLYSYLWNQYRYDPRNNNAYDKTYAKGTWVGIQKIDVYIPDSAANYSTEFFERVLLPYYHASTGDEFNSAALVTVHYEATTTTTTTAAYTAPDLATPVILEGVYTAPALTEPVVLSGTGTTTTVPVDPHITITYEWRPGGHRSTNPIEELVETTAIPAWVFTTTANYWQLAPRMFLSWNGSTETRLTGPNDHYSSHGQGVIFFWLYEHDTGTYPAWDNYAGSMDPDMGALGDENYVDPIYAAYLPADPTTLVDPETNSAAYAVWEKEAKKYGLDPVKILDQLNQSVDLTDNYSTVFEMGVSLTTQDPILLKYLYKLFKRWNVQTSYVPTADFGNLEKISSFSFHRMRLSRKYYFTGISTQTLTGTFSTAAKKGQLLKVLASYDETFTDDLRGETYSGKWQGIKLYYQVTDNTYEVLRVGYPMCSYESARDNVFGAEPIDERFILPFNIDVAWELGNIEFEYLTHRAMRLTQVIAIERKIEWMELPIVQEMLEIIQLGLEILQYFGFVVGVYNIMVGFAVNFVTALLIAALMKYGVDAALDLVIKELGVEASLILAVALAGTGVAMGVSGTEFMGGLIDGTLLLQAGNNLLTLVQEERMASVEAGYKQLQYNKEEFGEFYDEQIEDIEEARDLLNQPNHVNPFLFIGKAPMQIWGEGPQSFYERTIHSGNIGTKAFDFVHNYVEQKLRPPTFEQTVGDTLYAP